MLEFFGDVPEILVPDDLKIGINKASRYDPDPPRPTSSWRSTISDTSPPRKTRDKPKVEVGVQIVERWLLARLRHQVCFSLAELNQCIRTLGTDLSGRPFKKLPDNRREAVERRDKPALRPLPVQP